MLHGTHNDKKISITFFVKFLPRTGTDFRSENRLYLVILSEWSNSELQLVE